MSLETPISIIYDSFGTEISVSQSQIVSGANQPGLMIMGSASNGGASFFKMANDGTLFVTGTLTTVAVATQSVKVDQWSANVTASMKLDQWSANVTGAMGVTSWLTGVTASIREIGASTTIVSSANASTTNYNVLASNPNRRRASFFKEGNNVVYIKLGATASTTSYTVQLGNQGYYEIPETYTGQIDIIFSNNNVAGIVRVTDITTP